jgi:hypothetical protein
MVDLFEDWVVNSRLGDRLAVLLVAQPQNSLERGSRPSVREVVQGWSARDALTR